MCFKVWKWVAAKWVQKISSGGLSHIDITKWFSGSRVLTLWLTTEVTVDKPEHAENES